LSSEQSYALLEQFILNLNYSDLLDLWSGVPRRQPHRRSGLATLPFVGAVP